MNPAHACGGGFRPPTERLRRPWQGHALACPYVAAARRRFGIAARAKVRASPLCALQSGPQDQSGGKAFGLSIN